MPQRNNLELENGERLYYRGDLRSQGELAVTEQRLLIRSTDEITSVPYTTVSEISYESFDWFLGVLSVSLVVFGLYFLQRNPLGSGFFILAGVWSLYRTYRHRDLVRVQIHNQAKPMDIYPENVEMVYDELDSAIETVRTKRDEQTD